MLETPTWVEVLAGHRRVEAEARVQRLYGKVRAKRNAEGRSSSIRSSVGLHDCVWGVGALQAVCPKAIGRKSHVLHRVRRLHGSEHAEIRKSSHVALIFYFYLS